MRWLPLILLPGFLSAFADDLPLRAKPQQQLLVLNTGRVIRGILVPRTKGYDVNVPGGRLFIGSEQIRFRASDMDDAYQKMRDSFVQKTPEAHMQLARWCETNKLLSQARREVLDALHLDPGRIDAKRMLQALTAKENQIEKITAKKTPKPDVNHIGIERRSLGGLPGRLAMDFTAQIQPIISNKCGNTRCHGSDQNQFQIVNIRRGISAATSEQNLAAIFKQINLRRPENSPLLQGAETIHGGQTRPLFPGQNGRVQIQALKKWVKAVAADAAPGGMDSQALQPGGIQTVAKTQTALPDDVDDPAGRMERQASREAATRRQGFQQDAQEYTRPDQFNPDLFNLKYHGRTRIASSALLQPKTSPAAGSQPEAEQP